MRTSTGFESPSEPERVALSLVHAERPAKRGSLNAMCVESPRMRIIVARVMTR